MELVIGLAIFGFVLAVLLFLSIKKNVKLEQEIKKEKQNEKIDKETVEKIESIHTGDNTSDFDNSVNILHELAQKRK